MSDSKSGRRNPIARLTNAAASALPVNSIVESVDVDAVAERIDVEGLVERIDIDAVVGRIDMNALLARIDPDLLLDRVDPDRLLARVDVEALVARIDPDLLLARVDPNALLDRVDTDTLLGKVDPNPLLDKVDPNPLLGRVDTDALLERIDANALLERVDADALLDRVDVEALVARIDPNALLDRVDPNALLDRVDPNALLDRVDPNLLLERVDPNPLLDKVDPNTLLDRVDVDRLMDRVDIQRVVDRAGIADIVQESTGQVAGTVLDAARRQIVSLDEVVGRFAYRLVRKDPRKIPEGPPALVGQDEEDAKGRALVSGHYAGPVSRLLAFLIDVGVIFGLYTIVASIIGVFVTRILGIVPPETNDSVVNGLNLLGVWGFLYFLIGWGLTASTVGMGIIGLKVVSKDGTPITGKQALVRLLVYPLSFAFFGLGLLGIAFGSQRRAWHDKAGRTCVVIDWGDRPAALPAPLSAWLDKRTDKAD